MCARGEISSSRANTAQQRAAVRALLRSAALLPGLTRICCFLGGMLAVRCG